MILANQQSDAFTTSADAHLLPATHVSYAVGLKTKAYINSTTGPTATILFKGTIIGDSLAPMVASFSSRGPSTITPGILKPDIIGPGVNILAAWLVPLDTNTNTKLTFSIDSDTSMACPHPSMIAVLLKSAHPDWSPAAIKSTILTTASLVGANDPGLVYDISSDDYIPYLCGLGYSDQQVSTIARKSVRCMSGIAEGNYPTFSVELGSSSQSFTRTATNVGEAASYYTMKIVAPQGVSVSVQPAELCFTKLNKKASYVVTFSCSGNVSFSQGYLQWVSAKYVVRSVVSVKFT